MLAIALFLNVPLGSAAEGARTVTTGPTTNATETTAGSAQARGGFITSINLSSETQTLHWQGYYGNVQGNITLEDAAGKLLYRWAWQNTDTGEVYASESSTVSWPNIQAGTNSNVNYVGGSAGSDSAADTFTITSTFNVTNKTLTGVPSTYTYNASNTSPAGGVQTSFFRMGVLNDTSANEVFVTILENNQEGFDADGNTTTTGDQYDFQMIVPVNESSQTRYYFYLELS